MIRTNDFARQQRYLAHHRLDFQSQYNVLMHFPLIAQAMTYQASDFLTPYSAAICLATSISRL